MTTKMQLFDSHLMVDSKLKKTRVINRVYRANRNIILSSQIIPNNNSPKIENQEQNGLERAVNLMPSITDPLGSRMRRSHDDNSYVDIENKNKTYKSKRTSQSRSPIILIVLGLSLVSSICTIKSLEQHSSNWRVPLYSRPLHLHFQSQEPTTIHLASPAYLSSNSDLTSSRQLIRDRASSSPTFNASSASDWLNLRNFGQRLQNNNEQHLQLENGSPQFVVAAAPTPSRLYHTDKNVPRAHSELDYSTTTTTYNNNPPNQHPTNQRLEPARRVDAINWTWPSYKIINDFRSSSGHSEGLRLDTSRQVRPASGAVGPHPRDGDWQATDLSYVIHLNHEEADRRKAQARASKKMSGRKVNRSFGDKAQDGVKFGSWRKGSEGAEEEEDSRGKKWRQVEDWNKDVAHDKHGWKNLYHREELAEHRKFHDLKLDKNFKESNGSGGSQRDIEEGSAYKDSESGDYYDKNKHSNKYDYQVGSDWRAKFNTKDAVNDNKKLTSSSSPNEAIMSDHNHHHHNKQNSMQPHFAATSTENSHTNLPNEHRGPRYKSNANDNNKHTNRRLMQHQKQHVESNLNGNVNNNNGNESDDDDNNNDYPESSSTQNSDSDDVDEHEIDSIKDKLDQMQRPSSNGPSSANWPADNGGEPLKPMTSTNHLGVDQVAATPKRELKIIIKGDPLSRTSRTKWPSIAAELDQSELIESNNNRQLSELKSTAINNANSINEILRITRNGNQNPNVTSGSIKFQPAGSSQHFKKSIRVYDENVNQESMGHDQLPNSESDWEGGDENENDENQDLAIRYRHNNYNANQISSGKTNDNLKSNNEWMINNDESGPRSTSSTTTSRLSTTSTTTSTTTTSTTTTTPMPSVPSGATTITLTSITSTTSTARPRTHSNRLHNSNHNHNDDFKINRFDSAQPSMKRLTSHVVIDELTPIINNRNLGAHNFNYQGERQTGNLDLTKVIRLINDDVRPSKLQQSASFNYNKDVSLNTRLNERQNKQKSWNHNNNNQIGSSQWKKTNISNSNNNNNGNDRKNNLLNNIYNNNNGTKEHVNPEFYSSVFYDRSPRFNSMQYKKLTSPLDQTSHHHPHLMPSNSLRNQLIYGSSLPISMYANAQSHHNSETLGPNSYLTHQFGLPSASATVSTVNGPSFLPSDLAFYESAAQSVMNANLDHYPIAQPYHNLNSQNEQDQQAQNQHYQDYLNNLFAGQPTASNELVSSPATNQPAPLLATLNEHLRIAVGRRPRLLQSASTLNSQVSLQPAAGSLWQPNGGSGLPGLATGQPIATTYSLFPSRAAYNRMLSSLLFRATSSQFAESPTPQQRSPPNSHNSLESSESYSNPSSPMRPLTRWRLPFSSTSGAGFHNPYVISLPHQRNYLQSSGHHQPSFGPSEKPILNLVLETSPPFVVEPRGYEDTSYNQPAIRDPDYNHNENFADNNYENYQSHRDHGQLSEQQAHASLKWPIRVSPSHYSADYARPSSQSMYDFFVPPSPIQRTTIVGLPKTHSNVSRDQSGGVSQLTVSRGKIMDKPAGRFKGLAWKPAQRSSTLRPYNEPIYGPEKLLSLARSIRTSFSTSNKQNVN